MKNQINEFDGQGRNAGINLRLLLQLLHDLIGGLASGDEYEAQDAYMNLYRIEKEGFFRWPLPASCRT